MKNINKIILPALVLVVFAACKKNEAEITYSGGGTPPVLSANVASNSALVLSPADSSNSAITFSWTNPNYTFSNGISSLDVNYTLEIDTVGSNFTNPKLVQITFESSLTTTFTVGNLNNQLFGFLDLQTGVPHNIAMRVVSFLNSASLPLYSNTITYTITPYAIPPAVTPLPTALWITGSSTADGWMTAGQLSSIAGQQMTELSPTLWTITMPVIGGQAFLLVPANNWNNKYATSDASENGAGGTFAYNAGNNFTGPASSGTYTITFNFQTGVFTITQ